MVKDQFSVPTLLGLGALAQAGLIILLPARWALVPVAVYILGTIASTTIQTVIPSRNGFATDVNPGRTSAQLPNASYDPSRPDERPLFGGTPAGEQVVCFHLGQRFNHPLGLLSPGAREMGQHVLRMHAALDAEPERFGFLGRSSWKAAGRASHNTLLTVFYFRSVEGLHAFAHHEVHRAAWDWYNRFLRETGHTHLGIFHETFLAARGRWEAIYDNMPPTLLGAANVGVTNEGTGEGEFVLPLVDADTAQLRSLYGRMGRT